MKTPNETLRTIDDSINTHIKEHRGKSSIVTGWIVIASISDVQSPNKDGYILQASESLPHHTQVGLLSMALDDKRNIGIVSTLRGMMGDD
jgi:hypothetical protein|tara:strand:- start:263 stop:532 length:270 start_codon:yes stop_codon:yes gene_type:complete